MTALLEYILIIGSGGVEGLIDPPLCATPMHFSAKSFSEQSISHFVESHSSILIAKMVKFYDSLEIQLDFVPHFSFSWLIIPKR